MIDDAINILEFPKVLELIASCAVSDPGKERIRNLQPKVDIEQVNLELTRVKEMTILQEKGQTPPFKGIYDLSRALKIASVAGSMLSAETLLQFASTLGCARVVAKFIIDRVRDAPHLADMAKNVGNFEELENAVRHAIDESGEIRDSASPELKNIRHSIASERRNSRTTMATILRQWSDRGILQEDIIASRDGHLTLPVKDNLKSRAKGILIDQSSSGSTVYIEPIQLVEINNNIRKLELEEKREIERILIEITSIVFKYRFEIADTANIITEFDSIFARAEYALRNECSRPKISHSGGIKIVDGRHPLLLIKEKAVVPLNLEMPESTYTLVISGPNAGGKTVALKTVGLLTLMAMSGCFVPAKDETTLLLPTEIHAVIGDDQSIAADLSTFTAHVKKLSKVVETRQSRKLVLIDEIMSGTDPTEGTALAISILERLTADKSMTMVTTHKGDLKAFAHRSENVMNGSLEFDPENLSPTFRFRAGVPGSSYAFAIAKRVGLSEELIDRATGIRGEDRGSLDNLIIELQEKMSVIEREKLQVDTEKRNAQKLQNLLDEKLKNAREIEAKLKQKAQEEAEKILADAGKLVELAIKEVKETGASKESIKSARENVAKARETFNRNKNKQKIQKIKRDQGPIVTGDRVRMEDSEVPGTVIEPKNSKGKVLVETGGIRIWIDEKSLIKLEPVQKSDKNRKKPDQIRVKYDIDTGASYELDLRGYDSIEAAKRLEKFLFQASMSNLNEVSIIHGKGDGILRRVVGEVLKGSDLVKSSRSGEWGAGDYGVTIAEMVN